MQTFRQARTSSLTLVGSSGPGKADREPLLKKAIHCRTKNSCATKSTVSQGMLDVALLSANASQLKNVLQIGDRHQFYSIMVGLLLASILVQAAEAVVNLILCCLFNIDNTDHEKSAHITNNTVLALSTIATIINVVITAFDQ